MGALLTFEVSRIVRSPRFFLFTVGFPLVMFLVFSSVYGRSDPSTVDYLMISMAAYGAVAASIVTGSRTAIERQVGWNRQLRLTPLSSVDYLVSKVAAAMVVTLPCLVLVFAGGVLFEHVSLGVGTWTQLLVFCWLGVLPTAVLGLLIGLLATGDSAQAMGMVSMLALSMLGGLWFPLNTLPAVMTTVAQALPSYWLAEFGHEALAGNAPSLQGVITMAAWVAAVGALVVVRYRRDTARG
ncbi:ABC transporter permease [Kutzneria buriramensis]|uniref:ABC-2 type transport system permease protein n=1 Tax=Kutzneria buriramensis TaxID=1045776 RepID=A0A3E0HBI5_9PSEU|nr:ABC transporter permease [Kutzneria buriramensis]REH41796.1 ABC-2 type transport system permease protein [Kutzneria buriramensis]